MLKGYRGIVREFARTGTWRALWLQGTTGAAHVLRRIAGRADGDPIAKFFDNYAADGFRTHDPGAAALQLRAEACLVCGLCSAECARVGGAPPLDPRDAVVAASRLAIDWMRLGLGATARASGEHARADRSAGGPSGSPAACAGCRACDAVCPVGIPIHALADGLAGLDR